MRGNRLFCVSGLIAAISLIASMPICVQADENSYSRPSDRILLDENGNAYCLDDDGITPRTGRFSLSPDYLMGDSNRDSVIDTSDAANLLIAIARSGADGDSVEDCLCQLTSAYVDENEALLFSDTDENGSLDSSDAARILIYCAKNGSGDFDQIGYTEYIADENGCLQKGFILDPESGQTCYADDSYRLYQGWVELEDATYYLGDDYTLLTNCWFKNKGYTYYAQDDGSILKSSWLHENGNTYYLNQDGHKVSGIRDIDGVRYYFDENGLVKDSWVELADGMFYFDSEGIMQTGLLELDGEMYYLDENGIMQTGMVTVDDTTYYFKPESGCMAKSEIILIGEKPCYFNEDGIPVSGWFTFNDKSYYSDENGYLNYGLLKVEDHTYYQDENGICKSGWQTIDEVQHYFDENGEMSVGLTEIEGVTYYFDENGAILTGWQIIGEDTYYCNEEGIVQTGWQEIDGETYYFNETGIMQKDQEIDGKWVDSDGKVRSAEYIKNKERAQAALNNYGSSVSNIYNFVRSTTRYKKTESTKTLEQIESIGWLYFVDHAMTNYYGVCYYLAAKMDFVLTEAGYECRIVHATHGSGDHYWNQVNINGTWVNYDCTNGLANKTWDQMIAYGNYKFLGYVRPEYK